MNIFIWRITATFEEASKKKKMSNIVCANGIINFRRCKRWCRMNWTLKITHTSMYILYLNIGTAAITCTFLSALELSIYLHISWYFSFHSLSLFIVGISRLTSPQLGVFYFSTVKIKTNKVICFFYILFSCVKYWFFVHHETNHFSLMGTGLISLLSWISNIMRVHVKNNSVYRIHSNDILFVIYRKIQIIQSTPWIVEVVLQFWNINPKSNYIIFRKWHTFIHWVLIKFWLTVHLKAQIIIWNDVTSRKLWSGIHFSRGLVSFFQIHWIQ